MRKIYSDGTWLHYPELEFYYTQGEINVEPVRFILPKNREEVDLTELSYQIKAVSEDSGSEAVWVLPKKMSEQHIFLDWQITREFTAVPGRVMLTLTGTDSKNNVVAKWTGNPAIIRLDPQGSQPVPPPDKLEQFEQQLNEMIEKIIKALENAGGSLDEILPTLEQAKEISELLIQKSTELQQTVSVLENKTIPELTEFVEESKNQIDSAAQGAVNAANTAQQSAAAAEAARQETELIQRQVVTESNSVSEKYNAVSEMTGRVEEATTKAQAAAKTATGAVETINTQAKQIEQWKNETQSNAQSADTNAKAAAKSAETASAKAAEAGTSARNAAASEQAAEQAKTAAQTAQTEAVKSAEEAKKAATRAESAAKTATEAEVTVNEQAKQIEQWKNETQSNAQSADTNAKAAAKSAETASAKATEASTSAQNAAASEQAAEQAKTAAQTAQTEAAKSAEEAKKAALQAEKSKLISIVLSKSAWEMLSEGVYSQTFTNSEITENTKINLSPSSDTMLTELLNNGVTAILGKNNGGKASVLIYGAKPQKDITLQAELVSTKVIAQEG